jgi:hypothetical protein
MHTEFITVRKRKENWKTGENRMTTSQCILNKQDPINLTKDRVHGNEPYGAVKGIIS